MDVIRPMRRCGRTGFASGWFAGDQGYLGRPADIILDKDGSILVADDWAGAIYRISYKK